MNNRELSGIISVGETIRLHDYMLQKELNVIITDMSVDLNKETEFPIQLTLSDPLTKAVVAVEWFSLSGHSLNGHYCI